MLEDYLRSLNEKLQQKQKNKFWAREVSDLAMDIHEGVAEKHPDRKFVSKIIIPLVRKAYRFIEEAGFGEEYRKRFDMRIENLKKYSE